ncbi:MAG: acyl-CoA dehydrogenase family protein [Pseudomonadota bacterium]
MRRRLFDDEHIIFRESARKWVAEHVAPHAERWREQGQVDRAVWRAAGEAGYLAMFVDPAYGGLGLDDFRFDQILIEELTRIDSSFYMPLHNRIVAPYLHTLGSAEQKQRFLPGVCDGSCVLAIAMTEPGTGSDLGGVSTRAEDKGDHFELTGAKTYISNGQLADLVIVAARTDPTVSHGIGLFLVERGMPGFTRGRNLKKLGLDGQDTSELFFDKVAVPKANVLGGATDGFRNMMLNLAEERLGGAVQFAARAERAFEITLAFVNERNAFGQPIGAFQNTRFKLAELRTQLDAAWSLVDHCVLEHLENALTAELAAEAKLFTSEVEGRVVDECLQLHGGAGYMDEYEITRHYRDARVSRIYAGTSEIMKEIIGRSLGLDSRKR